MTHDQTQAAQAGIDSLLAQGRRQCAATHGDLAADAMAAGARVALVQCAETHADLVAAGARIAVGAVVALALAWWAWTQERRG